MKSVLLPAAAWLLASALLAAETKPLNVLFIAATSAAARGLPVRTP